MVECLLAKEKVEGSNPFSRFFIKEDLLKILKQDKKGCRALLEIEVPGEEYTKSYDKVLTDTSNSVKVPGFRPGKVPRNILEQNINPDYIKEKALDRIVEINYPEIIKTSGILPVDYPSWRLISANQGSPCIFCVEVDVEPEVKLGKYKGLSIERAERKIDEKTIDDYIKAVTEEAAQIKEITDRPTQAGDIAELDIEGSTEGKVREDLSQRSLPILLGDMRVAPGFDDNISGMNVGDEKSFDLELPADYFIPQHAGKKAAFKVKLNRIAQRDLPEFNDEFIKKISSFNTVEEYKADLRKRFEDSAAAEADSKVKDALLEKVAAESVVEIPVSMTARETDTMMAELNDNLRSSGLTLDSYLKNRRITEAKLREEIAPAAAARVKAKLVLKAVSQLEKITVDAQEIDKEIEVIAKESSDDPAALKSNENMRSYIEDYLTRRKALDLILENAKVKSK